MGTPRYTIFLVNLTKRVFKTKSLKSLLSSVKKSYIA